MTPPRNQADIEPVAYGELLIEIKARIRSARVGAAFAVNRALIELYWEIGNEIRRRRAGEGWGTRVIDRLAADLRREFPDMTGLSRRNLQYMQTFASSWPGPEDDGEPIAQRVVAQLPWGQNISLLTKLEDPEARLWYAQKAIEHGGSRPVLEAQIATRLRDTR